MILIDKKELHQESAALKGLDWGPSIVKEQEKEILWACSESKVPVDAGLNQLKVRSRGSWGRNW